MKEKVMNGNNWYCYDFIGDKIRIIELINFRDEFRIEGEPVIFKKDFPNLKVYLKHKIMSSGIIFRSFDDIRDWVNTTIIDFKEEE